MQFNERVVDESYINIVRSSNVLLKNNRSSNFTADITDFCHYQSDPEIGLILSTARTTSGEYLFSGSGAQERYQSVVDVMFNSVFAAGIKRISAILTAAGLIGQIPLEGDLQQFKLSEAIRKQALTELDLIIDQINSNAGIAAVTAEDSNSSIFLALDIDPHSIPPGSTDNYLATNAKVLSQLEQTDTIGACWFYISSKLISNSQKTEGAFRVGNWSAARILEQLAIEVNSQCLNTLVTNIVVSPSSQPRITTSFSRTREELNPQDPNPDYLVSGNVNVALQTMEFNSRHLSNEFSREVLIVKFYSINKTSLVPNSTYQGEWEAGTYQANDIVSYADRDYYATTTTTEIPGAPDTTEWILLNPSSGELLSYRSTPDQEGIPGLLYGSTNSYNLLSRTGLQSVIVTVTKGNTTANATALKANLNLQDTFFFRTITAPANNSVIRYRVSTSPSNIQTLTYTTSSNPAQTCAELFLNSLYQHQAVQEVLGALAQEAAVQMVAFKRTNIELRIIVDILEVPAGIEIAVGNSLDAPSTLSWGNQPRSIVIQATLGDGVTNPDTGLYELGTDIGVVTTTPRAGARQHINKTLQKAYDRIHELGM